MNYGLSYSCTCFPLPLPEDQSWEPTLRCLEPWTHSKYHFLTDRHLALTSLPLLAHVAAHGRKYRSRYLFVVRGAFRRFLLSDLNASLHWHHSRFKWSPPATASRHHGQFSMKWYVPVAICRSVNTSATSTTIAQVCTSPASARSSRASLSAEQIALRTDSCMHAIMRIDVLRLQRRAVSMWIFSRTEPTIR